MAKGIAKKIPHTPHNPPKNNTATIDCDRVDIDHFGKQDGHQKVAVKRLNHEINNDQSDEFVGTNPIETMRSTPPEW